MHTTQAIVRRPGEEMAAGITTAELGPPDVAKAQRQFDAYVAALVDCGISVTVLDPLAGFPDAHFVEDAAVVTAKIAVITRPGAAARRGEVASIDAALAPFRRTVRIQPPGTVDGGDVLVMDRRFIIGLSDRTNAEGARQLGRILTGAGYTGTTLPVADGLHLKSSVNAVGADTLLITPAFRGHPAIAAFTCIEVPQAEAYAANSLRVNGHLILPDGFPETRDRLQALGQPVITLDTSEFRKMDGGLTCLSLRF